MATYIDSNVLVDPAIILSFRGERLAGSGADASDDQYRYVIANECVRSFSIHVTIGKSGDKDYRSYTLSRRAQKGKRYFSDDLNAYLLPRTVGRDLEDLLVANDNKRLALSMDFEIDYGLLSDYILRYVARESDDGAEFYNMAFPAPGDEVKTLDNPLVRITHTADFGKAHRSTTTYKLATKSARSLTGVKCILLEKQVDRTDPSKPKVVLSLDVRLSTISDKDARRHAQRMFLAADHYKLIKCATGTAVKDWPYDVQYLTAPGPTTKNPPLPGEEPTFDVSGLEWDNSSGSWVQGGTFTQYMKEGKNTTAMQKSLRVWRKNLYTYFANYVDLARGERIRKKLIAMAKTLAADPKTTQASLVKSIRDEVDKYLITSNHWHGSRELYHVKSTARDIEHHQHILSDTFGEIHTSTFYGGSPVSYVRDVATEALYWDTSRGLHEYGGSSLYWLKVHEKNWSMEEQVAYCLQVGAGHCGEHAVVCYSVMVDAMKTDPNVNSKAQNIVLSGNASIDHAFCIVGMKANTIWHDVRTKDWGTGASFQKKGERLVLWDLKDAVNTEKQKGFVMDAYLGDLQRATAESLLKKIQASPEFTHYVSFRQQYPHAETVMQSAVDPDIKKDI